LKKPGGTNLEQRPEPLVFYIDECLGKGVGIALQSAGAEVRFCGGDIARGALDPDWLPTLGEKGWICLTKDKRIRLHAAERSALLKAGVKAFVLTSGNLTGVEMADIFVKNLRRMENMARRIRRPFIAKVTRTGVVEEYDGVLGE